jgi:hypothetical protein
MIIPPMNFGVELKTFAKGRIGEMMACMPMEYHGFTTFNVNFEGVDIVALNDEGVPFTVEVKSASKVQRTHGEYPNYVFGTQRKINADWVAFCSLDLGIVLFEKHDRSNRQPKSRAIRVEQFTPENMASSLAVLRQTYGH